MNKRESNFFEAHIEEIVLVLVVILCIWILFSRVLISPNYVEYNNRKFSTGEINDYVLEQAEGLEDRLSRNPTPKESYNPRLGEFKELFDCTVRNVDLSLVLPKPGTAGQSALNRKYKIPDISDLADASVVYIRAVAYVPTQTIDEKNPYDNVKGEPNDIDFVTVEAKLDVSVLYENFHDCFAGFSVDPDWRDPSLAKPTFAAVELQRQQLLADGIWSDWDRVERSVIDHRKDMFEIVDDIGQLPAGGIKIRLLQFGDPLVMRDLLQPNGYRIATPSEDWFPPSFYDEYSKVQKEKEVREKRKVLVEKKSERQQQRMTRGGRTSTVRTTVAMGDDLASEMGESSSSTSTTRGKSGGRSRLERRDEKNAESLKVRVKQESVRTEADVYKDYDSILITEETDLSQLEEPLLIWANDDSVEPGNTYRYRIRVGIFNPIAGTDQFKAEYESMKDKVILWSNFSEVEDIVDVPAKQYFFARDIQEAAGTVTVQVSKYILGRWYSKDFSISKGEDIGSIAKVEVNGEQEAIKGPQKDSAPEEIDYNTGAILVDVKSVNDWSGEKNLRARQYFSMLYSFDGISIDQMPIRNRYWTDEQQLRFGEIKRAEKAPIETLRGWQEKGKGTSIDSVFEGEMSDETLMDE